MNSPTIGWLCDTVGADTPELSVETPLNPISIDSRTLKPGDTFWALKANRDGHDFVGNAFDRGAKAAVVDVAWKRSLADTPFKGKLIGVSNPASDLSCAAKAWRKTCSFPVIGITGSNGKTSTKDLLIRLLSVRYRTSGTQGNLNNHFGVPLTLLSLPRDLDAAVIEMGASFRGEIGMLCEVCRPTHGLVTSMSGAHLEGFGNLEAVAETKGQLYDYVANQGIAFVPTDDALCVQESFDSKKKVGYAFHTPPKDWIGKHYLGSSPKFNHSGCGRFDVQGQLIAVGIPGRAAALTALAGLTVACELGVSLSDGAKIVAVQRGTRGRLEVIQVGSVTILDDSYNANPASMQAALDTLTLIQAKRRVAILGDMCELGAFAEEEHVRLGNEISRAGISAAIFIGELSRLAAEQARSAGVVVHWFLDPTDLLTEFPKLISPGDVILVKASRALALELIVEEMKKVFA